MRVCYKLRREIEDLFPAGTTPAERLVALEIAEFGKLATRISLIDKRLLCSRTGLSEEGLRKALWRLSKRGLQFRRGHGIGNDGREVYTYRGAEIEFCVPSVDDFAMAWKLSEGGTTVPPSANGHPVDKPP